MFLCFWRIHMHSPGGRLVAIPKAQARCRKWWCPVQEALVCRRVSSQAMSWFLRGPLRIFALWCPGNAKTSCEDLSEHFAIVLALMFWTSVQRASLWGLAPWYRFYDLTWQSTLHMQRIFFLFKNVTFCPASSTGVNMCRNHFHRVNPDTVL